MNQPLVFPVGDTQQIEVFDERQAVRHIQAVGRVHICVKEGDTPSNETLTSLIQCVSTRQRPISYQLQPVVATLRQWGNACPLHSERPAAIYNPLFAPTVLYRGHRNKVSPFRTQLTNLPWKPGVGQNKATHAAFYLPCPFTIISAIVILSVTFSPALVLSDSFPRWSTH